MVLVCMSFRDGHFVCRNEERRFSTILGSLYFDEPLPPALFEREDVGQNIVHLGDNDRLIRSSDIQQL